MAFSPFRVFSVHPFQKEKPRRIAKKREKPKKTGAELLLPRLEATWNGCQKRPKATGIK
jgi:hypothetical protein